jgi:membrane-bound lytic murein transglycosylase B
VGTSLRRAAVAAVAVLATTGVVTCGGSSSDSALASASPEELSAQISANDAALRDAIDAWRAGGDPPTGQPPDQVIVPAGNLQETARYLAGHPNLAGATIALLSGQLAGEVRQLTKAARDLRRLSHGTAPRKLKVGPAPPLAELLSHYEAAEQRYAIGPHYLAAIHLVETKFGQVKSNSVAGAKGPMQFIPSTWRIYGRGGNIKDPHDAILAAANLLRQNGAPRSYGRALYHYNPSRLYVDAVQRYARVIAGDPYGIYFLYCWEP